VPPDHREHPGLRRHFAPGYCVGIDPDEGADGGYQGSQMAAAVVAISRVWEIEIVNRPELSNTKSLII
jgi:hypothetical protein